MQSGNASAVSSAVTALENDVHNASPADLSGATHSHFEHMWH
jgi:hypothetical protein